MRDRADAAFEFCSKLNVPFWCFHDFDLAPEGATIAESERHLRAMVEFAKERQIETGMCLLWGTANLFSNPRYMNGASTNPDFAVVAHAGAQVKAALDATEAHFLQEGVEGHFLWGDIGDPDRLDRDLQGRHGFALCDLLNVRSFLDHNRVFNRPAERRTVRARTTGAYAFRGERLRAKDVEQSLKEHFLKWRPHVARHGLLVIELHTMSPSDAAQRHGRMPATAYDATHGFSDQYIVEVPVYDAMAEEAGLIKDGSVSRTLVAGATLFLLFYTKSCSSIHLSEQANFAASLS